VTAAARPIARTPIALENKSLSLVARAVEICDRTFNLLFSALEMVQAKPVTSRNTIDISDWISRGDTVWAITVRCVLEQKRWIAMPFQLFDPLHRKMVQ
jgi:hypothetical protein